MNDRRRRLLAALLVATGIPLGILTSGDGGDDPPPAGDAEPAGKPTPNVRVALHLDEPIVAGKTVVWTVAFQAAWDALGEALGAKDEIPLGPPADPEDVRRLNEGRLVVGIVDPKALTVVAGPADESRWAAIDRASDRGMPAGAPPPSRLDIVAYARLRASVRYAIPFSLRERPLLFGAKEVPVRAYGLRANASGEMADRMREQARVHVDGDEHGNVARSCVLVLSDATGARVFISGRPPKATLRETFADVAAVVASKPAREFGAIDSFSVPRVSVDAGRSYDELVGAPIVGTDGRLVVARQDVRFTVDEKGADVDAEAILVDVGAIPLRAIFDGPFLVAMLAPKSDVPYVVAWIGSADALSRWDEAVGRPLTVAEAKPLVGAWTLDRAASLEATARQWRAVLTKRWSAADRDAESVAKMEKQLRQYFETRRFDLVVRPSGAAEVESGRGKSAARRSATALVRDGARIEFALPRSSDEGRGEERFRLTREGARLVVSSGQGETLVLVRK